MSATIKLTETLDLVKDDVKGNKIAFGDVAQSLNHRGFGPLLLAPSLITILPTGAIPGVPAFSGIFIALISLQILCGRKYPWLPQKLKSFSFKRSKFTYAIRTIRPYTEMLDKLIKPRLQIFSNSVVKYAVAALCLILALMMILVGFLPMIPAVLSLPILFFALGLSAKDGIMTLTGLILTIGSIFLIGCATGISCIDDRIVIGDPEYFTQARSYVVDLDILKDFR